MSRGGRGCGLLIGAFPDYANQSPSKEAQATMQCSDKSFYDQSQRGAMCKRRKIALVEATLSVLVLLVSVALAIASHLLPRSLYPHHHSNSQIDAHTSRYPDRIQCHLDEQEISTKDCIFDEMLNGWVPSACYNEQLASEALQDDTLLAQLQAAGHFQWYADLDHTTPITTAALPGHLRSPVGNMTAHTIEKWHVAHCLYVWRLGHEAFTRVSKGQKQVYVNSRVLSADHVQHCNEVIASQEHRVGAKAVVYFALNHCVRIS